MKIISVDECKNALELAIGEAEYIISDDIINATIHYLNEYQRLKNEMSWEMSPECMGR